MSITTPTDETGAAGPSPSRRRSQDGVAALEFALIFVIFATLVYGAVTYGLVLTVDHALNAASAEGARAAVGTADEVAAIAAAESTAMSHVGAIGSNATFATATATTGNCPAVAGTRCLTLTVSYPWQAQPLSPPLPLFDAPVPETLTSVSTIQLTD